MKEYFSTRVKEMYAEFSGVLKYLSELTSAVGHSEMDATVADIAFYLQTPYMFVIVGEVKAGKSSFVNALLHSETEICAVAPSPMTDTIQQIVYGAEHKEESLSPLLKRIYHPEEILKNVTIVDTPGTNTIIEHHQEITENFIPHADLIVFVFEAKNPYRQSAWDFFDYIQKDWRKNIIFILQQKDLLDKNDLMINMDGVKNHATKKGIDEPKVFAVSAKEEQAGKEGSGFTALRSFINDKIIKANTAILKLESNVATAHSISDKIGDNLRLREEQYQLDLRFRQDIKDSLDAQEVKTNRQIDVLTENLLASYDGICAAKVDDLSRGLSIGSVLKRAFSSVFGGDKGLKVWLQDQAMDFELRLNKTLKKKLQDGIIDVSEDIQMMGKLVNAKIENSKTVLKDSNEIFASIAERRSHVLADLQKSFRDFMDNADNFYDQELLDTSGSMTPNIAMGSGMAVIGVMLSTLVNGIVFDITGGILTTVGVVFASVSVGWKRARVLKRFKQEIARGREQINEDVSSVLKNYTERIKQRIDKNFYYLDAMLDNEKSSLDKLNSLHSTIYSKLDSLQKQIEQSRTGNPS